MRVATWNVNSLKVRLPQVLEWLKAHQPDVLCLQETKLEDPKFPVEGDPRGRLRSPVQRAKNLQRRRDPQPDARRRTALTAVSRFRRSAETRARGDRRRHPHRVPVRAQRPERRIGQVSLQARLARIASISGCAAELAANERLVVVGDFNIAPDERDVHDPKAWEGQVLFSAPERAGVSGPAGDRTQGQLSPVRAAAAIIHVVGLPDECVQAQDGPAHRSYSVEPPARPRCAAPARSTSSRAKTSARPITRR